MARYAFSYSRSNASPSPGAEIHVSRDCKTTLCGRNITTRWWVMDVRGVLPVTCSVCRQKEEAPDAA